MLKNLCVFGGVVALTAAAQAQVPAVVNISGGSLFGGYYSGTIGDVIGYRFTADVDMTVTHFGLYNDGVLDSAHEIGIWRDSDQALLGSTVIDSSNATLEGQFWFTPTNPIDLVAGERYTIGALDIITDGDSYISNPATVTYDGISDTIAVFPSVMDLGFVYPTEESPANEGRFGPNFKWVPAGGGGFELSLEGSCPGRITANATGATPNGLVAYVFGAAQGSTTIPGGPCAGTQLGIQGGVRLIGTDSADGSGNSSLSGNAPGGACGRYLQALDVSTCTTSNVAQIN